MSQAQRPDSSLDDTHDREPGSTRGLCEYLLLEPGRPVERLISEPTTLDVGHEIVIRNRLWIVAGRGHGRLLLVPKGGDAPERQGCAG